MLNAFSINVLKYLVANKQPQSMKRLVKHGYEHTEHLQY